jgi:hypothetical protein
MKGAIMDRSKPLNPIPFVVLFFIGVATLYHFSHHVRTVDAVGLSGSGFAFGIAVSGLITALRARIKA